MQAYAGQAKESNTATGETESDPIQLQPERHTVIQHFHTGRFNTMVTKTPISPQKQHGVHEPTFFNFNPPSAQSTTTVTLPFG